MIKGKRKTLQDALDKLFSVIIRGKGKCEKCGRTNSLVPAHIFSRKNLSVRWDKDNVFCFCIDCHSWAHRNPNLFTEFAKGKLGNEKYEELKRKSVEIKKWSIIELKNLYKEFKEKI